MAVTSFISAENNIFHLRQKKMSIEFYSIMLTVLLSSCSQAPGVPSVPRKETTISGKLLFEENCSACHSPEIWTMGPPFQRIREVNGLDWSISWVKNSRVLIEQRDTSALYIFYSWNKLVQPDFPHLSRNEIESIFDYVDSFPFDSTNYEFRKYSKLDRWNYIDSIDRARKYSWDTVNDTLSNKGSRIKVKGKQAEK